MLSDAKIAKLLDRGDLRIEPRPAAAQMQPVSIDLRLDGLCYDDGVKVVDSGHLDGKLAIYRGEFLLGSTVETVTLPRDVVGTVAGKSSWARRGLLVEAAGLVDPGFSGQLTLELFNMSGRTLWIPPGATICQITFDWVSDPVLRPYGSEGLGSHYQGQTGPTPAYDLAEVALKMGTDSIIFGGTQ